MSWQFEGRCVITGEKAQEALPRMGDSIELISPSLGRYRISATTAETIQTLPQELRVKAYQHAKESAAEGNIPLITSYSIDPTKAG